MLRVRFLGGFQLEVGGRIVNRLRLQKALSLLAYLLSNPRPHTRTHLIQIFWNDKPAEAAQNNLRVALSLIRRVLEPPGIPAGSILESTRRWVGVKPSIVETDVGAFEAVFQQAARCADPSERQRLFQQACELYAGDFLPELDDAWVIAERERLRQLYEAALNEARLSSPERASPASSRVPEGLGVVIGILSETPDPRLRSWARAAAATQRGFLLEGGEDRVYLFFNSLDRAFKSLDALHGQLNMCRFAVEVGELRPAATRLPSEPLDIVESMLQVGALQQVLCTERVAVLTRQSRMPSRCELLRLGIYRIGPLGQSEMLYQLNFRGRAQSFPTVKALPMLRSALVDAPTAFVGREEELMILQRHVQEAGTRLITIVGAPGVGKSRLALEFALRSASHFGEARWWIHLTPDASIGETLARRLGWEWRDEAAFVNTLSGVLQGQPALLLIDGLDEWTPRLKEELERLLHAIPGLSCVVTTHAPLSLPDEWVYVLKPLPIPPIEVPLAGSLSQYASVQLFTERTRQNAPHFELTDQNAAEVASLCRYLEGLPLAIELAAAHSGGKNLTHLLKQLQRSTRWLRERPAGTLSRSLYASLTTVYRSLPPEARLFWMRLSVFRAGFTLKAAQAVASPPDAAAALPELERRSLVQAQDGRYRLLEPLRLFAETQLKECGVTEETRLAHLRYYLKLATALGDAPTHWAELEQERENLHAALEWGFHYAPLLMLALVEALELFWERRGCEQATYQRLLQLPYQFRSAEEAARAARVALNLAVRRGDMEQAQRLMEQYLPVADALPENSLAATRFWIVAGFFAWMQGDYDRSVELLQRAIQRARISNAALDEATAWVHLGVAHWTRQELDEAANALQCTLQLIAPLETPILRMKAMSNLANVLYQMGKREEAESYLAETLLLAQQLGDRRTAATLLNNWAVWMREQGDYERARELCLQAGAIWQELHEAIGETASVFNLADIALQVGDVETASFMFHRSLESILRYRLFWYLPPCLEKLAELARRENNLSQARSWQCARLYASLRFGQPNQIAPSLQALAELALAHEAFPEAARWTLLMEPVGKRTPPDNLFETLRKRFSPTEWRQLLQEAHSIRQEELIEQLQPYFDELSLPHLSC